MTGDGPDYSGSGGEDPVDGDDGAALDGVDDGRTGHDGEVDDRTDPEVGEGGLDPEEMTIEELRAEIEAIDRELVETIARRTYVADTIARVKDRRDMATTDERQEERVMDRAAENAERFDVDGNLVKAIFRLLIELNKIEQREKR